MAIPLGPVLILSALGVLALATSSKTAKAASPNNGLPVKEEFQQIPLALMQEMGRVVQALTITDFTSRPDGSIETVSMTGPVTKEAIQAATALAAKLDAAGFTQAARTIRELAVLAGKRLPSPAPEKQIPLPIACFTVAEQDQVNRLVAVERDPKVLQGVLDALKKRNVPAECKAQVDNVLGVLQALIVQGQARIAEEEALRKIEEELRKKNSITPLPPGPLPVPPSPAVTPRVTIVQSGDGFIKIATRLLGNSALGNARWRELRDRNIPKDADGRTKQKDSDAKGGMKPMFQPGHRLFVPESWTVVGPSIPVPGPVTPSPVPAPATGPRTTTVQSGDGFIKIATRLLGNSALGNARWRELRDRNIPVDADGRQKQKDTDGKGGMKPMFQPGHRLFVPESWSIVVSGWRDDFFIGDAGEALTPKTAEEMGAESLVSHLNRLQRKHPGAFDKVARKVDKRIVARFQKLVGLPVTATVTPAVLLKAAEHGQAELPLVLDWPADASKEHVIAYRGVLLEYAKEADARGDKRVAHELGESIKREMGQAARL